MSSQLSRTEAWDLLSEWVESPSLRKHCLAVEAAMVAYARKDGEDEERWAVAGLLHDADYERFPDLDDTENGHPRTILKYLRERDFDPEIVDAIAGHAPFLGVARETQMAKTLWAVDELSGFIMACAYVRPEGIHGMTPKSVKKKLKATAFAAAVNRDEVRSGAEELGVDFDEHVRFVIAALEERADELELNGRGADSDGTAAGDAAASNDAPGLAPAEGSGPTTPEAAA
jgi:putative nucleotidyltransferase with HDIG domain